MSEVCCPKCLLSPADYLAQKEWIQKNLEELKLQNGYMSQYEIEDFHEVNPMYTCCTRCKQGGRRRRQVVPLQFFFPGHHIPNTQARLPLNPRARKRLNEQIKEASEYRKKMEKLNQFATKPQPKKQKRNALCSCKSGKKYKKCCLIGQRLEKKI